MQDDILQWFAAVYAAQRVDVDGRAVDDPFAAEQAACTIAVVAHADPDCPVSVSPFYIRY